MVLFNDYLFYYAGCCIHHRYDYGAIILLDEKNRAHISKWLRLSIRMYGSFEKSLDELRSFFREVNDLVFKNKVCNMNSNFNEDFPFYGSELRISRADQDNPKI
ncbi:hypothetical protein V6Z12_D07G149000 [Gossypium hirsutum]